MKIQLWVPRKQKNWIRWLTDSNPGIRTHLQSTQFHVVIYTLLVLYPCLLTIPDWLHWSFITTSVYASNSNSTADLSLYVHNWNYLPLSASWIVQSKFSKASQSSCALGAHKSSQNQICLKIPHIPELDFKHWCHIIWSVSNSPPDSTPARARRTPCSCSLKLWYKEHRARYKLCQ